MSDNLLAVAGGWLSEHPACDLLLAGAVLTVHITVVKISGHGDVLAWLPLDGLRSTFETGAGVVATLGGLASISLAVYQGSEGRRNQALRKYKGKELRRNWRWL